MPQLQVGYLVFCQGDLLAVGASDSDTQLKTAQKVAGKWNYEPGMIQTAHQGFQLTKCEPSFCYYLF